MNPLVDKYNITKYGNINGEAMKLAVKETRKFIIKLALVTTPMFIGSLIYYRL